MGLWLPEARFEMPELFEPGRKPVGNVRIDYSHQLAKYLQMYYMFPSYQCLVRNTNNLHTLYGSPGTKDNYVQTIQTNNEALALHTTGTSLRNGDTNNLGVLIHMNLSVADQSLALYPHIFMFGNSSGGNELNILSDNLGNLTLVINDGSLVDTGYQLSDVSEHNVVIFLYMSPNELALYVNGKKLYSQASSVLNTGTSNLLLSADYDLLNDSVGNYMTQKIYSVAVFEGVNLSNYAQTLTTNPYQFLIPA